MASESVVYEVSDYLHSVPVDALFYARLVDFPREDQSKYLVRFFTIAPCRSTLTFLVGTITVMVSVGGPFQGEIRHG